MCLEEAKDTDNGVVILTSYSGTTNFTSELVWYASIAPAMATSQNGDCPYSVGSNGVLNTLTRAAPVISISTGMNSVSADDGHFIIDFVPPTKYSHLHLSSTTFNGYNTTYPSTQSYH